jgi:hypothetical protein
VNAVAKSVWKVLLLILAGCSQPLVPEEPEKPRPLDSSYSTTGSPSVYSILKEYNPPVVVLSPANTDDVPPQEKLTLHGRVVSTDDKLVASAIVACWCRQWDGSTAFIGKVMTDADGRYSIDATQIRRVLHLFDHVADNLRRKRRDELVAEDGISGQIRLGMMSPEVQLFAADAKNAIGWTNAAIVSSACKEELDILLRDQSGVVAGGVVDEDNKAVVGQKVWLRRLDQFSNWSEEASGLVIPFEWTAMTDENGKFVFSGLPGRLNSSVAIRDERSLSSASPFTTPDMNLDRVKAGHYSPNPCSLIVRHTQKQCTCLGQLIDENRQPIAGAVVRGNNQQTTTNKEGKYELKLSPPETYLTFEFPLHERIPAFQRPIDWGLALRGKPEAPIEIRESEWISGRVLSSLDDSPVPGIKIMNELNELVAISDDQGFFQGLCRPEDKMLRMIPALLSQSEQHFWLTNIAPISSDIAANEQRERQLGDLRIPVNRPDDKRTQLRVVLPDGSPASGARVAIWTLKAKSPEGSIQSQIFNQDGKRSYFAVTNQDGDCSFTSVIKYDAPQFAVVAYPSIDPTFFGELQLVESNGNIESPPMELRLVPSRTLSGLVTFNGKPRQATRVIATPKALAHLATGAVGQPVFQFIKFVSATDSLGRYSIQIPDASGYSVDVLHGFMDGAVRSSNGRTHERNLPVLLPSNGFSVPVQGSIDGPTISFLQGDGVVRGKVLGFNGKPFYAPVHLDLPVGTVVLNLSCREDTSDEHGRYDGVQGRFELTGVPAGTWNAYATTNTSGEQNRYTEMPKDSDLVPVMAGDRDKTFVLNRHAR